MPLHGSLFRESANLSSISSCRTMPYASSRLGRQLGRSEHTMKFEHLKKRLDKNRPMTAVSIRFPVDVIGDLKRVAPLRGFSGYNPLVRVYVVTTNLFPPRGDCPVDRIVVCWGSLPPPIRRADDAALTIPPALADQTWTGLPGGRLRPRNASHPPMGRYVSVGSPGRGR